MINDIQYAFDETLKDKINILENQSLELRLLMDSMSILEVLIILEEEKEYNTKFINVDDLITISDLINEVKKYNENKHI